MEATNGGYIADKNVDANSTTTSTTKYICNCAYEHAKPSLAADTRLVNAALYFASEINNWTWKSIATAVCNNKHCNAGRFDVFVDCILHKWLPLCHVEPVETSPGTDTL